MDVKADQKTNRASTVNSVRKMYREHAKKAAKQLSIRLDAKKVSEIEQRVEKQLAF
jgi:hypothetical protein